MATVLKYWDEASSAWKAFTGDVPAPHASIVVKGGVFGDIDGTNKVFNTGNAYVAGTLQAYVNGVAQSEFIAETDPAGGAFTLSEAPVGGSSVKAYFHVANTAVGNADSIGGYQLSAVLESLFPVGSKYDSGESPTLPPLIASIGTWERFKGRVVVGVDEAQTEFDAVGEQGGAKTHTLSLNQIPNVTGSVTAHSSRSAFWQPNGVFSSSATVSTYTPPGASTAGASSVSVLGFNLGGGGQAHNNLQPYETTYMWKRIA